jgi:hypothetical protein
MLNVGITFLIYKRISPVIKGAQSYEAEAALLKKS